jgi:hypothetical protein
MVHSNDDGYPFALSTGMLILEGFAYVSQRFITASGLSSQRVPIRRSDRY